MCDTPIALCVTWEGGERVKYSIHQHSRKEKSAGKNDLATGEHLHLLSTERGTFSSNCSPCHSALTRLADDDSEWQLAAIHLVTLLQAQIKTRREGGGEGKEVA